MSKTLPTLAITLLLACASSECPQGSSGVGGQCLEDKPDPVFCDDRCVNSFWTTECEETCNIVRPSDCAADQDVCPLGTGGDVMQTGGEATGGTTTDGTQTGGTVTGGTTTGGTQTGGTVTGGTTTGGTMTGGTQTGGTTTGGTQTGGTQTGGIQSVPCDGPCLGVKDVCNEVNDECVQCTAAEHCDGDTPACVGNACEQCAANPDCTAPDAPRCKTLDNTCIGCHSNPDCDGIESAEGNPLNICDDSNGTCFECVGNTDCTNPAAPRCDATSNTCTSCNIDTDCDGITADSTALNTCDAETNICVQCTRDNATACGKDSTDRPYVCDSLKTTCTTEAEHTASACKPCVADLQCLENQICVMQKYGDAQAEVGYFCMTIKDSGGGEICNAAPFSAASAAKTSIDGATNDICTLRASTCVAHNVFGQPCSSESDVELPDHLLCKFRSDSSDGFCIDSDETTTTTLKCAPVCGDSTDCKVGFTCQTMDGHDVCKP